MIKMLIILVQVGFDINKLNKRTGFLLRRLQNSVIIISREDENLEIIPLEEMWQEILIKVKKKEPQLKLALAGC